MNQVLVAIGALLLGCALRTLLPYVVRGFQDLQENKPWPSFEVSYLGALGLAVIAYALALATMPGAFASLLQMGFIQIVALAYAGQDIIRQVIKVSKR